MQSQTRGPALVVTFSAQVVLDEGAWPRQVGQVPASLDSTQAAPHREGAGHLHRPGRVRVVRGRLRLPSERTPGQEPDREGLTPAWSTKTSTSRRRRSSKLRSRPSYVGAWVLVTHKETIDLERDGMSAVGVLIKNGQPFPMTRGILDVALETERRGQQGPRDEE